MNFKENNGVSQDFCSQAIDILSFYIISSLHYDLQNQQFCVIVITEVAVMTVYLFVFIYLYLYLHVAAVA